MGMIYGINNIFFHKEFFLFFFLIINLLIKYCYFINSLSFHSFTACLHMACVILGKDCKQWFAELNVDMEKV